MKIGAGAITREFSQNAKLNEAEEEILTASRPTWKDVWHVVEAVERPNIGLCLDTFQTAGYEYGDPTTANGLASSGNQNQQKLESDFHTSLLDLSNTVPAEKIYLLQISDAYKLSVPFEKDDDEIGVGRGKDAEEQGGLKARGRWSMKYRPRPFNGGYLPVVDVAKAVLATGFRGWFSMEIFDAGPQGKAFTVPKDFGTFCKGAMESHRRLLDECADS